MARHRVSAGRLLRAASFAVSTRCRHLSEHPKPASRRQKEDEPTSAPVERGPIIHDEILDRRRAASVINGDYSAARQPEKTTTRVKEKSTKQTATPAPAPAVSTWEDIRKKMSRAELKRLMKEYGPVAATFHTTVFLATLGSFYSLTDYGLDVSLLVKDIPIIANNLPSPGAGKLAVAWGLTSVTGPVRALMTITLTPRVARFWWGREVKRKLKNASVGEEEKKKKP